MAPLASAAISAEVRCPVPNIEAAGLPPLAAASSMKGRTSGTMPLAACITPAASSRARQVAAIVAGGSCSKRTPATCSASRVESPAEVEGGIGAPAIVCKRFRGHHCRAKRGYGPGNNRNPRALAAGTALHPVHADEFAGQGEHQLCCQHDECRTRLHALAVRLRRRYFVRRLSGRTIPEPVVAAARGHAALDRHL